MLVCVNIHMSMWVLVVFVSRKLEQDVLLDVLQKWKLGGYLSNCIVCEHKLLAYIKICSMQKWRTWKIKLIPFLEQENGNSDKWNLSLSFAGLPYTVFTEKTHINSTRFGGTLYLECIWHLFKVS